MQFNSLSAFIYMEGHGIFVWSVYVVALSVLTTLAVTPLYMTRRFFIEESMRQRRLQSEGEIELNRQS